MRNEPVVVRAIIAAGLNILVLSEVIDTGVSELIETAALAVLNVVLALSARSKVRPV